MWGELGSNRRVSATLPGCTRDDRGGGCGHWVQSPSLMHAATPVPESMVKPVLHKTAVDGSRNGEEAPA